MTRLISNPFFKFLIRASSRRLLQILECGARQLQTIRTPPFVFKAYCRSFFGGGTHAAGFSRHSGKPAVSSIQPSQAMILNSTDKLTATRCQGRKCQGLGRCGSQMTVLRQVKFAGLQYKNCPVRYYKAIL